MYRFYLGLLDNSEEEVLLPVSPEEITLTQSGSTETYSIYQYGQVVKGGSRNLLKLSLSSFFPIEEGPYVVTDQLAHPSDYVNKLFAWKQRNKVMTLKVTGGYYPIDRLWLIEDFQISEKAGEVGDIYYTIDLTEYRVFKARRLRLSGNTVVKEGANTRPLSRTTPVTYTVRLGDTLWKIAKLQLGDGSRYQDIASLNGLDNPNIIYPGQVLKLPRGG